MKLKNRYTADGRKKHLKFYWIKQSLNDLVEVHVPCYIYYQVEEHYPIISLYINRNLEINSIKSTSIKEVLDKMKSLLYRGSKANILIKKSVYQMRKIDEKEANSPIVKIGFGFKTALKGYEVRVLTEDYTVNRESISIYCEINELNKTELHQLTKQISKFHSIG